MPLKKVTLERKLDTYSLMHPYHTGLKVICLELPYNDFMSHRIKSSYV